MSSGVGFISIWLCLSWCDVFDVRCYIIYYIIILYYTIISYYILYYTLPFLLIYLLFLFSSSHLLISPLPIISSSNIPPIIQSIRVGVYCWILISPRCLCSVLFCSHLFLHPSSSSFPSPSLPSSLILSSLSSSPLPLSSYSLPILFSSPSFKVYVSAFGYPYLYSTRI